MADTLIWGASGGIGQALAEEFADKGWRVFAAARQVENVSPRVTAVFPFDAGDPGSFASVNRGLALETKGLDLVVYAAGYLVADRIRDLDARAWSVVLDTNLTGAFLAATHSLPLLNEGGQMVFIGAYVDHVLLAKMGAYAVAKSGLEALVPVLRKEQRTHRFCIVRPGAVDTDFWENAPFKKPGDAKSPRVVAREILAHYDSGSNEDLNL